MAHSPIFHPPIDSNQRIRQCFTPPKFSHVWYSVSHQLSVISNAINYGWHKYDEYLNKHVQLCEMAMRPLRYSSRLSLRSRVPFTHVFINFIRGISQNLRVTARESYFMRCTRVILRVLHTSRTWRAARGQTCVSQTSCAARE